jgi:hypothetical protein
MLQIFSLCCMQHDVMLRQDFFCYNTFQVIQCLLQLLSTYVLIVADKSSDCYLCTDVAVVVYQ